ncbi:hypothetical protein TNCV_1674271 [Trichonephila clavipes]|nr:hypothetical protein TNCV_1674271 [Trichonephila clavipes]
MGSAKSVISRLKKTTEGGNVLKKHAGGCIRNTTHLEDRYVVLGAKRNRNFLPSQIAANIATATGHRRERLRWCKKHVCWDPQNCSRVMFSHENRFSVTSPSGHQLLCRERGTRSAQKFVWERDRYGPAVRVWVGILHNERTPLHIFE